MKETHRLRKFTEHQAANANKKENRNVFKQ